MALAMFAVTTLMMPSAAASGSNPSGAAIFSVSAARAPSASSAMAPPRK